MCGACEANSDHQKFVLIWYMHGPCTKCINTEASWDTVCNTPLSFLMLGVLVTETETVKAGNTQKLNYKSTSFFTMGQTH